MTHKSALSVMEFAKEYGLSRPAAYTLAKRSDFPAVRLGRRIVIPVKALEEWLANGGTQQRGA